MPTAPEFGEIGAPIRPVEIRRQADSQQLRAAAGDVGIAGEVEIQLQGVGVDRHENLCAAIELGSVEHAIHEVFGQQVGDARLLEQSESDQEQGTSAFRAIQRAALRKLPDQLGDTRDGARLQGGKERDGGEVGQQAGGALGIAAVEIERVGEGLEGVEGEAEGEDPVPAHGANHRAHVARADQQRQVDGDTDAHKQPAHSGVAKAHQPETHQEVRGPTDGNQRKVEQPVARAEVIIGQQDDAEAKQSRLRGGPVNEEYRGDEDEVRTAAGCQAHGSPQGNNELSRVAINPNRAATVRERSGKSNRSLTVAALTGVRHLTASHAGDRTTSLRLAPGTGTSRQGAQSPPATTAVTA